MAKKAGGLGKLRKRNNMSDIEPKTEAWSLESLQVNYKDELWSIRCGGACQPEYNITAHTLEQAVSELVKQVTHDAIEDEARDWQNRQLANANTLSHSTMG